MSASGALFSASYRVLTHEHVDDKFAKVVVRCVGYPTEGTQPVEWAFVLKVPKTELGRWPLGGSVRLAVTPA
jgi:hypothetical protein